MKIVHAYNVHRSGGGATAVTESTIRVLQENGQDVKVVMRRSIDLPKSLLGHWEAGISAFRGGEAMNEFVAMLDSFQPDVVHGHELFPLISPWILPECIRRGIPVVLSCNDYHLTCPVRNHVHNGQICTRCLNGHEYWSVLQNCRGNLAESISMALYCAMVRKRGLYRDNVSHYMVLSEFTRQWLIDKASIDPTRVTCNPPIIDLPDTTADPAEGEYVAFAGRFVPEKGIDTLLEAARISGVPLCLSRNEEHFVTVQLPPNVRVVVTRTKSELTDFYRHARMLVLPSTWFETFGVVGAEAMALGIPVVASRIGAVANLLEDGVDGLYFEPGNAQELARKITALWNDPEQCRRLGRAGRQRVERLWSPQRHFELAMSVYNEVLRAKP